MIKCAASGSAILFAFAIGGLSCAVDKNVHILAYVEEGFILIINSKEEKWYMDLKGKKIAFLGDSITQGVAVSCKEHIY